MTDVLDEKQFCERCGTTSDRLYTIGQEDEEYEFETGEIRTRKVCWDCDHDVINGGDLFEDSCNVLTDRQINNYEYDPINEVRPFD